MSVSKKRRKIQLSAFVKTNLLCTTAIADFNLFSSIHRYKCTNTPTLDLSARTFTHICSLQSHVVCMYAYMLFYALSIYVYSFFYRYQPSSPFILFQRRRREPNEKLKRAEEKSRNKRMEG